MFCVLINDLPCALLTGIMIKQQCNNTVLCQYEFSALPDCIPQKENIAIFYKVIHYKKKSLPVLGGFCDLQNT